MKVTIFTILRNFLEFFWIYLDLFSIFKLIKTFKKMAKMGAYFARAHVDATWHARPHGSATRTRASACVARRWHLHIYFYYIGYSTYKPFHRGISLTSSFTSRYMPDRFHSFSPCGTMFPLFYLISGCVAWRGASDQHRDEKHTSMRWMRGPLNLQIVHVT